RQERHHIGGVVGPLFSEPVTECARPGGVRHVQVESQQGYGNCDHAVRERLQACLAHRQQQYSRFGPMVGLPAHAALGPALQHVHPLIGTEALTGREIARENLTIYFEARHQVNRLRRLGYGRTSTKAEQIAWRPWDSRYGCDGTVWPYAES